jgi:hypothetical protein
MAERTARGEEFEKKADKKINGWGLFGSKFEDAAEFYEQSANSFKLAKSCTFGYLESIGKIIFLLSLSVYSIGRLSKQKYEN